MEIEAVGDLRLVIGGTLTTMAGLSGMGYGWHDYGWKRLRKCGYPEQTLKREVPTMTAIYCLPVRRASLQSSCRVTLHS